MPLPPWFRKWTFDDGRAMLSEGIVWMRSRPASVQSVMLRLPPSCVVRIPPPAPFSVGIVSSFFEDEHVTVRPAPDSCRHEWIRICANRVEVIGYWHGLTPERVRQVLGMGAAS